VQIKAEEQTYTVTLFENPEDTKRKSVGGSNKRPDMEEKSEQF
jgi:hypothetical protein